MIQEFRDFIAKGNVIMLAVGFIMGVAFQGVVNSLVENVIMPIAAIPFGQPNFDELTLTVNDSVIMYGAFITATVVFLLTALAVFLFIVKPYNAWADRRQEDEDVADPEPTEVELLVEIRDALKSRPIG
jgi:large conductance mechanosensitive channel